MFDLSQMLPQIVTQDLLTVGFLVFLEGVLSIDNAVVLALLASQLPKSQQKKALTYGLIGAIVFRLLSLSLATHLMRWTWVKYVGGGYLLYVAISHWISKIEKKDSHHSRSKAPSHKSSFWKTVVVIELTDIAFAVDSILAAVAMSNKFWVVFTGGVLGLISMRFAATMFIQLLEKFPKFETSAYLLVFLIGAKLVIDGFDFPNIHFHSSDNPAFWIFWIAMAISILVGFIPERKKARLKKGLQLEADAVKEIEGRD